MYRSFIALYECGTYYKAEKELGLNRSTIRHNIQALSDQLGLALFRSTPRGSIPSKEAVSLYNKIQPLIDGILVAEKNISAFDATITMAIPSTAASFLFTDFFKSFREQHPNVRFKFYNRARHENFDLLVKGKLDILIDVDFVCKKYDFKTVKLATLGHVFISSKKFLAQHGLTAKISKEDISKLPVICHYESVDIISDSNNLVVKPYITTATSEPIYYLVKEQVGIGFYVREIFEKLNADDDIVVLDVADFNLPTFTYVCGYSKHCTSKAAQELIKSLMEYSRRNYLELQRPIISSTSLSS